VSLNAQTLQTIGRRMAAARALRDLTQEQLAKKAGLTQVTIARLEKGRSPQVSVATLLAIAESLGVSTDYLLGRARGKDEEDDEAHATRAGAGTG
jgi:transcriptional regulator with XRE-family HTH domain